MSCVGFLAGRLWGRDRRPGGRGTRPWDGHRCSVRGPGPGMACCPARPRSPWRPARRRPPGSRSGPVEGRVPRSGEDCSGGRTRRVAGRSSKPGSGWCWSPAADQHDATAGVEPAPAEAEAMLDGVTPLDRPTDPGTGETAPITPVTDNDGPFRLHGLRRTRRHGADPRLGPGGAVMPTTPARPNGLVRGAGRPTPGIVGAGCLAVGCPGGVPRRTAERAVRRGSSRGTRTGVRYSSSRTVVRALGAVQAPTTRPPTRTGSRGRVLTCRRLT